MNGVPIAGYRSEQYDDKSEHRSGVELPVLQFCPKRSGELHVQSNHDGNADDLGEQPSDLALNGYVGGVMVTASGGASPPFTNYTNPYVITNLTEQPGDVGIFLPGSSSEMLAVFNVGSVTPPTGGMAISSYVFGSLNGNGLNGLNSARGTYVNPSNFAARDAAVFANGANIPVSLRTRPVPAGDRRLLQSADGYGRQRRREYVRISDLDFLRHTLPLARASPPSGVSGAPSTAQTTQRPTRVRGSRRSLALGRRRSDNGWRPFRQPARPLIPAMPSPISLTARRA